MGLINKFTVRALYFVLFCFIIISIPGFLPEPTFPFTAFKVAPAKHLKGVLEVNKNNRLNGAERLLEGLVHGPEHLLVRNNKLYTGIHGEVIKVSTDGVSHIAKFEQPCGLAFDIVENNLIVADIYNGLWEVDVTNGKKKLLISAQQELDGKIKRQAKTFNSVAVDKKGDVYWTDSSSDRVVLSFFANPSGRLFHYDRVKNESKCLLDELFFANGVVIGPNEEFLVIAETAAMRLLKYHLKGSKRGQHEVFVDGLPGTPDNLTPDNDGIWVPLFIAVDGDHLLPFSYLSQYPMIRIVLARLFALFEMPFRVFKNVFPNALGPKYMQYIGQILNPIMSKRLTIIRVDWNGNILGSLHGFDKSIGLVSHVVEQSDHLLLGSPFNDFIGKVKLPKLAQSELHELPPSPKPIPTEKTTPTLKSKDHKPKKVAEHGEL